MSSTSVNSLLTPKSGPVPSLLAPKRGPVPSLLAPKRGPVPSLLAPKRGPVPSLLAPKSGPVPSLLAPKRGPVPSLLAPKSEPVPSLLAPKSEPVPSLLAPKAPKEAPDASSFSKTKILIGVIIVILIGAAIGFAVLHTGDASALNSQEEKTKVALDQIAAQAIALKEATEKAAAADEQTAAQAIALKEATEKAANAKAAAIAALAARNTYTNSIRTTPILDVSSGDIKLFKDFNIDCGANSAITGLKFNSSAGKSAGYSYTCAPNSDFVVDTTKQYTNWNDAVDVRYLDRHSITCADKPLNSLQLEVNGDNTKMRYGYKCAKPSAPMTATAVDTPHTSFGGATAYYLDRQNVNCPSGSVMSNLKMNADATNLWYTVGCAKYV